MKLSSNDKDFEFLTQIKSRTNKKSFINSIYKANINIKIKRKKKSLIVKEEFIFFKLIIVLLISNIFKFNCLNKITLKDSIITLKVSQNGEQKIFNRGTTPFEMLIDWTPQPFSQNYNLNPTNTITLKWRSIINDCSKMFEGCDTIIELNFINFEASGCSQLNEMFYNCFSLISLDLSGFKTSNSLNTMANMFVGCHSLISVNLSTFVTSNVDNFGNLFRDCQALKWVDISKLRTETVKYMDNMFNGCKSLTSVNLSNFDTSKMETMENMFKGCESLKIIDFPNLDVTKVKNNNGLDNAFLNCKKLEYINIKNLNSNKDLKNNFFDGAPKSFIICINNNKKNLIRNIIDSKNYCILINCTINLSNFEYKLNTENDCFIESCSSTNYTYEFQGKCYEKCPNNTEQREINEELEGYTLDDKYLCKPICNETIPFEITNKQKCVEDCDLTSIIDKSCILNYQDKEQGNSLIFNNLLEKYEDFVTSNDFDISKIETGINEVINYENMKITLTSTTYQKNNENNCNGATIDLLDCEKLLKDAYNISYNESLFIKIVEVKQEGMLIPKIEYDVYYKLNGVNLTKLNLSYCYDVKIDIFIPVNITDNIDKHNSKSGYYNDICYVTTSDSGTDISLKDRKAEFIDNNLTLCQENCQLSEYKNSKVKCSCDVKESSNKFNKIKIDKEKSIGNLIDIKNIVNINMF